MNMKPQSLSRLLGPLGYLGHAQHSTSICTSAATWTCGKVFYAWVLLRYQQLTDSP